MPHLVRTNSRNKDFQMLVSKLDKYLAVCDGDEHDFYDQYNKLDSIKNVIVVYENEIPVGCGTFKEYAPHVAEIKRMYVEPESRNKGIAGEILKSLEFWAKENSFEKVVLETGKRQFEAVEFYKKSGYQAIPNFPPYQDMDNSICFQKVI